jgi:hypothetical protein
MADNDTPQGEAIHDGDKVVQLTDQIMANGPAALTELDRKRAIMFRAFELTAGQLDHDATELTTKAVMHPDAPMIQREHMIATAYHLREAAGWIKTMLLPQPAETKPE